MHAVHLFPNKDTETKKRGTQNSSLQVLGTGVEVRSTSADTE